MRPIIIFVFLTWLVGSITAAASPPTSDQRFQMHSAKVLAPWSIILKCTLRILTWLHDLLRQKVSVRQHCQ